MRQIFATKPEMPEYDAYIDEIKDIFDTGILTNDGPKMQRLQQLLKSRMGCENVEMFVNGHLALWLGISAFNLPKGGEVLTSPFTFISTTNAIIQNELIPVFCDIDDTYNISIDSIKRNITDKTCAIITPHIFGIPCHVKEIEEISNENNLKVIYDAAQAFGTKVGGKDIGIFGDATMFSLHAIKVFNSIEGGILCYKDVELTRRLKENRNFGVCIEDKMDAEYVGINAKMDEFRASMGIVNLRQVDANIKKRKKLTERYCKNISNIDGFSAYSYEDGIDYNYAYFPAKIDTSKTGKSRDELFQALKEKSIGIRKLYSRLTCDYRSIKDAGYRCDVEYARKVTECCLDLPIYSTLEIEDIDYITDTIQSVLKS